MSRTRDLWFRMLNIFLDESLESKILSSRWEQVEQEDGNNRRIRRTTEVKSLLSVILLSQFHLLCSPGQPQTQMILLSQPPENWDYRFQSRLKTHFSTIPGDSNLSKLEQMTHPPSYFRHEQGIENWINWVSLPSSMINCLSRRQDTSNLGKGHKQNNMVGHINWQPWWLVLIQTLVYTSGLW